jgi:hypothetical protein
VTDAGLAEMGERDYSDDVVIDMSLDTVDAALQMEKEEKERVTKKRKRSEGMEGEEGEDNSLGSKKGGSFKTTVSSRNEDIAAELERLFAKVPSHSPLSLLSPSLLSLPLSLHSLVHSVCLPGSHSASVAYVSRATSRRSK